MGEEVKEFGLIQHTKVEWLAASPDGITPSGKMLEIKCPFRRKITGIPPLYYTIQCLIQLEVCDLEECDFQECKFIEYKTEQEFLNDTLKINYNIIPNNDRAYKQQKGLIVRFGKFNSFTDIEYFYPPKEMTNPYELIKWGNNKIKEIEAALTIQRAYRKQKCLNENPNQNYSIKKVYWKLDQMSIVTIKRDRSWFSRNKARMKKVYDEMKLYQDGKLNLDNLKNKKKKSSRRSSEKTQNPQVCLIDI